jgi:hypothetical protein
MSRIAKPRPVAFLMRGYDLADALKILERWDTLSEAARSDLFTSGPSPEAQEESESASACSPTLHWIRCELHRPWRSGRDESRFGQDCPSPSMNGVLCWPKQERSKP